MKKKGFTLIELLAVIVVLAVIALIATPIVLNLVKTAKIGSAEQSVTGYVKAVENTIIKDMLDDKNISDGIYKYDSLEVDVSGKRPTSGKYTVKNGRVESGNFCVDGYYIEYKNSTSKYNKDKECGDVGPTKVDPTGTDTHKGIVYLDPTNLKNSCNALNSVSGTGTKTGCMKWYIYSEDNNSYTMILDHNTTAGSGVAYNSTNSNGEMKEVKTALESNTSTWDKSLKARLITANEIAKITGNTSFDEKTSTWDSEFYFDSNNQTQVANKTNKSKYAWLYDYTSGCADYGCNIEHPVYFGYDTNGYWTSATLADDSCAWAVNRRGELYPEPKSYNYLGTRPVITISKSIIS